MAPDAFEPLLGHYYRVTGEMATKYAAAPAVEASRGSLFIASFEAVVF